MDTLFSELFISYYYGSITRCRKNWSGYNQRCSYSKIYYILDGECELVIDGQKFHVKKGDMALIPSGTTHSFYHVSDKYVRKYWFHFELEAGGNKLFNLTQNKYTITLNEHGEAKRLCRRILHFAGDGSIVGALNLRASLLSLISFFLLESQAKTALEPRQDIANIINYINHNINRKISLNHLADLAHMHPTYFIRFFTKHIGLSPMCYVNRTKVEMAKSMLQNSDLPISEIMVRLGFNTHSQFSAFFKRYTSFSPSQFRTIFYRG